MNYPWGAAANEAIPLYVFDKLLEVCLGLEMPASACGVCAATFSGCELFYPNGPPE